MLPRKKLISVGKKSLAEIWRSHPFSIFKMKGTKGGEKESEVELEVSIRIVCISPSNDAEYRVQSIPSILVLVVEFSPWIKEKCLSFSLFPSFPSRHQYSSVSSTLCLAWSIKGILFLAGKTIRDGKGGQESDREREVRGILHRFAQVDR